MDHKYLKTKLRSEMLERRDALSLELKREYDNSLTQKLIHEIEANSIKTLHICLPMRSEVNLFPVIDFALNSGIKVVCPKSLKAGILENRILESMDAIEKGVFGTSHPSGPVYVGRYDMIVVPGLAFSSNMNRLGYGGGYYDRFLVNHQESLKLSTVYPFQIVTELPVEEHDLKVDQILLP